jgi:hypothetical protein
MSDGVHSAGQPAPLEMAFPAADQVGLDSGFMSLRFGAEHRVLPMAMELRDALVARGGKAKIVNMQAGGDIDTEVFKGIEECGVFIVFGSKHYGEDTGNQACTYFEYKHAFALKKRIVLLRMIPFDQEFAELQARVIFNANMLVIPWLVGRPMPADLVDKILEVMRMSGAQPEPEPGPGPGPASPAAPSPTPLPPAGAWPAELAELMGIVAFVECLASLGVKSLADFADCIDVEEGHDKQLQAVLEALPSKPRKNKVLRNRALASLADLLQRLALFIEYDSEEQSSLSRADCLRIPAEKMQAKVGGTVGAQFDAIDADKAGRVTFRQMFEHTEVTAGEGVPPAQLAPAGSARAGPSEAERDRSRTAEAQAQITAAMAAEDVQALLAAMRGHGGSAGVQEQGCLALTNLMNGSDARMQAVADAGGAASIVAAMRGHGGSAGVQEQGCLALRNLTFGGSACLAAMRSAGAEAAVRAAIGHHPTSAEVNEAGAAVLRKL